MRPLPGAPGVAAAAALLLLLLSRARADEHEHTVRRPDWRGLPGRLPCLPSRQARRGLKSRAARCSPAAVRGLLPVGPGGAGTAGAGRRHFREPRRLGLASRPGLRHCAPGSGAAPGVGDAVGLLGATTPPKMDA
jgi:hypothetical protein